MAGPTQKQGKERNGGAHAHGGGCMSPKTDKRSSIAMKIASAEPLTAQQVREFAQIGYLDHVDKAGKKGTGHHPMPKGKGRRVVGCSDARSLEGDIAYDQESIAFESEAGNTADVNRTDIMGHGGYGDPGCGAYGVAKSIHASGREPSDEAMKELAARIPKDVCESPEGSRANTVHQAKRAEGFSGQGSHGIHIDVEAKTATLVHGENDDFAKAMTASIESALRETGNLSTQVAGFVVVTREGRRYTGKTTLSADANQAFETNFVVGPKRGVALKKIGKLSRFYAAGTGEEQGHVGGVNRSRMHLVLDHEAEVARKAAALIAAEDPKNTVIVMHEDVAAKELKHLETILPGAQ